MRSGAGGDGASDDPDNVLCERAARESNLFAGGDREGAANLEDPRYKS